MDIMRGFGIPVPRGGMATNLEEASQVWIIFEHCQLCTRLNIFYIQVYKTIIGEGKDCVIKAMVLTGGRGLGHFSNGFKGGVHLCSKPGDVVNFASKMLGSNLITKQTTAEGIQFRKWERYSKINYFICCFWQKGLPCSKVMIVERMYLRREMYISIMLDRSAGGPIFIASPAGGTSIEDVAAASPELIFKQPIDIVKGITDEQSTYLATSLGFVPGSASHAEAKTVVEKLYQLFRARDCTLLVINLAYFIVIISSIHWNCTTLFIRDCCCVSGSESFGRDTWRQSGCLWRQDKLRWQRRVQAEASVQL